MSRLTCSLVALASLFSLVWLAGAEPAPPAAKSNTTPVLAVQQRADFPGLQDPNTTLAEALDQLGALYKVSFEINEKAFKFEMVDDVLKKQIGDPPILPKKDARLGEVLSRLLSRVVVNSGAHYLVREESIEITTGLYRESEVWGPSNGPHLPLVHRKFDAVPLAEALTELSRMAEFNVVLDMRVADKAKTPITARFLNTPLDTAVRFLTDMTDLGFVHLDNVLYVTTKENAAALEARLQKERELQIKEEKIPIGGRRQGVGRVLSAPVEIREIRDK